jgi:hypothetical protein
MRSEEMVAEYSFTGMATRPKEIVNEAIDRAGVAILKPSLRAYAMRTNSSVKWQEARQIRSKNQDSQRVLQAQYRTNARFTERRPEQFARNWRRCCIKLQSPGARGPSPRLSATRGCR